MEKLSAARRERNPETMPGDGWVNDHLFLSSPVKGCRRHTGTMRREASRQYRLETMMATKKKATAKKAAKKKVVQVHRPGAVDATPIHDGPTHVAMRTASMGPGKAKQPKPVSIEDRVTRLEAIAERNGQRLEGEIAG